MIARWVNGFGEDCESRVFAELTDDMGFQWLVVREWRSGQLVLIVREEATLSNG